MSYWPLQIMEDGTIVLVFGGLIQIAFHGDYLTWYSPCFRCGAWYPTVEFSQKRHTK